MDILYYSLTVLTAFFVSLGALGKKYSNAQTKREKFLNISVFSLLVAAAMWVVFAFTGEVVNGTVLLFSAIFAVNFVVCNYTLYAAMELGSLSKTNLFNSLSLVIPTLAGIVVWKDPFNIWLVGGAMILMIASLLLIILKKEDVAENDGDVLKKSKVKWLIFNVIAFVTNGLSSIIQKCEQIQMNGEGAFSMTALSFTLTALVAFVVYLFFCIGNKERPMKNDFIALMHNKKSVLFNALGLGVVNLATTYLSTRVPAAFLFPCILGGSVIVTTVFSAIFFKEKISWRVAVGVICGVAAIVLFSL